MTEIHQEDPYHWAGIHYSNRQPRYSYHRPPQPAQPPSPRVQNIYQRPCMPGPFPSVVPRTPYPSPVSSALHQPCNNIQPPLPVPQPIWNEARQTPENIMEIVGPLFLKKGTDLAGSIQLGSGRYSKVITAKQLGPGNTTTMIAMKVINTGKVQDDFVRKFLPREIECWRQLDHPYLVKILGHYECLGHVFLTMEYGSLGDLLRYVQKNGPLSERRARGWLLQMLHGVGYMHMLRIAHRDLKLENVVLFPDGSIKVADFGFARKVEPVGTLSGTFCGSRSYSAPEILLGQRYNPYKSDVWSLGVIAFIMVTDKMPFREKLSTHKITDCQRRGNYHYPSGLSISEKCRQSIAAMLTFDPVKRPQLTECLRLPFFTYSRPN